MVHEELSARLNDGGYKNCLKAGYCLKLRDGLHSLTDTEMRSFHGNLVTRNTEILRHQTHPSGTVNWGNCRPPLWNQDHWELAKAYMPR
ncbi:unnamed protein product, partial [Coregonus sp. 'balchen']